jgi:hypothetical protein
MHRRQVELSGEPENTSRLIKAKNAASEEILARLNQFEITVLEVLEFGFFISMG